MQPPQPGSGRSELAQRIARVAQLLDSLHARCQAVGYREQREPSEEQNDRIPVRRDQDAQKQKQDAACCASLGDRDAPRRRHCILSFGGIRGDRCNGRAAQQAPADDRAERCEGREHGQYRDVSAVHASLEQGAGEVRVDLSTIADPESLAGRTLEISNGLGATTVYVPDGTHDRLAVLKRLPKALATAR